MKMYHNYKRIKMIYFNPEKFLKSISLSSETLQRILSLKFKDIATHKTQDFLVWLSQEYCNHAVTTGDFLLQYKK